MNGAASSTTSPSSWCGTPSPRRCTCTRPGGPARRGPGFAESTSGLGVRLVPTSFEAGVTVRAARDLLPLLYMNLLVALGAVEVTGLLRLLSRMSCQRIHLLVGHASG